MYLLDTIYNIYIVDWFFAKKRSCFLSCDMHVAQKDQKIKNKIDYSLFPNMIVLHSLFSISCFKNFLKNEIMGVQQSLFLFIARSSFVCTILSPLTSNVRLITFSSLAMIGTLIEIKMNNKKDRLSLGIALKYLYHL